MAPTWDVPVLFFIISALAGILLKSQTVYFFSENFSYDTDNSDILFGSDCKRGN